MRFPVKLNRGGWPQALTRYLPSAADVRVLCQARVEAGAFTDSVSSLKFGTTFKTTGRARFPNTITALAALDFAFPPAILDVGASDGSTSLDIMRAVPFSRYFVTDRNIEIRAMHRDESTWFFDADDSCIMAVSDRWVSYPDFDGAWFPFGGMARRLFAGAPALDWSAQRIQLISPALRALVDDRIAIRRHDIFEPWAEPSVGLVIAANILNRAYFSDEQIVAAVANLVDATTPGGRIVIVDNREVEASTIFRVHAGRVELEVSLNGGTDIESLVLISNGRTHD